MFAIFVLLASGCAFLSTSPDPAEGILVGKPVVSIRILQDVQSASVAPNETGSLQFTGEVAVEVPLEVRTQYLFVYLEYSAGGGNEVWIAVGTSQVIFVAGTSTQPFNCVVKVPEGTLAEVEGYVTVSGTWEYEPGTDSGEVTPDTAAIRIEPFSIPILDWNVRVQSARPNEIAVYELTVRNKGNAPDEYTCAVRGDDGLWVEDDIPDTFILNVGEQGSFSIMARSNSESLKRIHLKVTGSYVNDQCIANETFELKVGKTSVVDAAKGYLLPGSIALAVIVAMSVAGVLINKKLKKGR
jgi:hypothetical protein